jgi:hypothetical protein
MRNVLFLFSLCVMMIGCDHEPVQPNSENVLVDASAKRASDALTYYGPAQPIGTGVVRTFYTQSKDGTPLEVGIRISAKALENLPAEEHAHAYRLKFHSKAAKTGYTFVGFEWNPHGHEPPGVYDLPHFDIHFYTLPEPEVLMIGPDDEEQFDKMPDLIYQPPMYFKTPGGVPQMGAHWIDLLSPEIQEDENWSPFTYTFIYGSYDGEFIFYEPMVTLDYLLGKPDETIGIRQPAAYQKDGYYASHYRISYSETPGEYTIALTNLEFHQAHEE